MSRAVLASTDDDLAAPIDGGPFPLLLVHQHFCQTFAEALSLFVFLRDDELAAFVNESPKIPYANCGTAFSESKRLIKSRLNYEFALRINVAKLSVHFCRCQTFAEACGVVELHDKFARSIDEAPLV